MRISITLKLILLLVFALGAAVSLLSYAFYREGYRELEDKFGLTLKHIAVTAAVGISAREHSLISKSGDQNLPAFKKIRSHLQKVMHLNDLSEDTLYTFHIRPDNKAPESEVHFGVMLHKKPFIGNVYRIPSSNKKVFAQVLGGQAAQTGVYQDEHGYWVSGLAPIIDARGKVTGVLEADYRIDKFVSALRTKTYDLLLQSALVTAFALLIALLLLRRLTKPISQLQDAAESIEIGYFDIDLKIKTHDEFRELGETFNNMAYSLKDSRGKLHDYAQNLEEMVEERTFELKKAQQETARIMDSVQEGLFLLRKSEEGFIIGDEYSRELELILESKNLANSNFLSLLEKLLPENRLKVVGEFLGLLFAGKHPEKMLQGLNPLTPVEASFPDNKSKHLKFDFIRIQEEDNKRSYLVTVRDVTSEVQLTEKLKHSEAQAQQQMKRFFSIIHVPPENLFEFINAAKEDLTIVADALERAKTPEQYQQMLDKMFRAVHSLKGDSDMLGLSYFTGEAHGFEDKIVELQEKSNLTGLDFLPVTMGLGGLRNLVDETEELVKRLAKFHKRRRRRRNGEPLNPGRSEYGIASQPRKGQRSNVYA